MKNIVDRAINIMAMSGHEPKQGSMNPIEEWMYDAEQALAQPADVRGAEVVGWIHKGYGVRFRDGLVYADFEEGQALYTHPSASVSGFREEHLWSVLEAATEAMDRRAAPHAFISLAWEGGSKAIVKLRDSTTPPQDQEGGV